MKIKRELEVFWIHHRDPILLCVIVVVLVIGTTQLLNYGVKEKNKKGITNKEIYTEKEVNNNLNVIREFISKCKENKVEEAYSMISKKCKEDLYSTVSEFKEKYYDIMFTKGYDIETEYDSENNLYKIIFYESVLQTGKLENRKNIVNICKIETEVLGDKIYIYSNYIE